MDNLFEYGNRLEPTFFYKASYWIPEDTWTYVQEQSDELNLSPEAKNDWRGDKEVQLSEPFSEFVVLFKRGSERLLAAIRKISPISAMPLDSAQKAIEASTYGIFAPAGSAMVDAHLAEWAVRNHLMPQVTLPTSARVLLCARELKDSVMSGDDPQPSDEFLMRAVLVHEHFHAIVETAFGMDGLPPVGTPDSINWAAATALNESLAAWMEWHDLRRLAESVPEDKPVKKALAAVSAYIRSGQYPGWPYRGAEHVEELYRKGGIAAVRDIIDRLRRDPRTAQEMFDGTSASHLSRSSHHL